MLSEVLAAEVHQTRHSPASTNASATVLAEGRLAPHRFNSVGQVRGGSLGPLGVRTRKARHDRFKCGD